MHKGNPPSKPAGMCLHILLWQATIKAWGKLTGDSPGIVGTTVALVGTFPLAFAIFIGIVELTEE